MGGIIIGSLIDNLEVLAGLFSLLAAYIHFEVTPEHWAEMPQHGAFMASTAVLQLISGALYVFLPDPPKWGLWATVLGNLAIIGVAMTAYTVGIGDAPEPLNSLVIQATVAEVFIVILTLVSLALRHRVAVRYS